VTLYQRSPAARQNTEFSHPQQYIFIYVQLIYIPYCLQHTSWPICFQCYIRAANTILWQLKSIHSTPSYTRKIQASYNIVCDNKNGKYCNPQKSGIKFSLQYITV